MIGHSQVCRVGQKGFVIPVRFEGQAVNKLKWRGLPLAEFLGDGRQVAAIGIHPDTGRPYEWTGGSPLELTRDELVDLAVKLPQGHLMLMQQELERMDFKLDPRDQAKAVDGEGKVGSGGRNNTLLAQVGAAFSKGKTQDQAWVEVLGYDLKHHREPLFLDNAEAIKGAKDGSPEARAQAFVANIYKSLTADRLRSGEALPTRLTVADATGLAERVAHSARQGPAHRPRLTEGEIEALGLQANREGMPANNEFNVGVCLRHFDDHRERFWFDEFYQRIMVATPQGLREWQDIDDLELLVDLQRRLGWHNLSAQSVRSAVEVHAYANAKNAPKDWLEVAEWDGDYRLDDFCQRALGAEQNDYVRAVGRNWWVAMVARIYRPGCKFDNMVVLEGRQGARKSSALEVIAGHWFGASGDDLGSKDFLQNLGGKLLIELPELDSFGKSGIRTIKRILSNRVDTYRPSYGRRSKDYRRQCVFVGTTNEDEYLEDPTGGRRFWPVKVGEIDLEYIREYREQLFAEAVYRYKRGDTWWEVPDSAEGEQDARRRHDPWDEAIMRYFDAPVNTHKTHFILTEIARGALELTAGQVHAPSNNRIAACLKRLGWTPWQGWHLKERGRWWVRPGAAFE